MTYGVRVKKVATTLRGITKRKARRIVLGISHAEKKGEQVKKNTAKMGLRAEGKAIY
eukprot:CAMPEP_0197612448 /NCGR_PEP_ID=MMETSP1326-20131121/57332_1 /TAXON_ID=1155430 /ORGANISM="Genus nov. species nov., Strain RCC2288" /LENGTH=56 /DNA_ID=CAMNT_0043181209 /DNA_START=45 /DNA_END=215 /DNA_ORIENTATION=-